MALGAARRIAFPQNWGAEAINIHRLTLFCGINHLTAHRLFTVVQQTTAS